MPYFSSLSFSPFTPALPLSPFAPSLPSLLGDPLRPGDPGTPGIPDRLVNYEINRITTLVGLEKDLAMYVPTVGPDLSLSN